MKIDKSKLKNGIWCEDEFGNYIPFDDCKSGTNDKKIHSYHVCFPLNIREEIYFLDNGKKVSSKPDMVSNTHIGLGGGAQEAIINMVLSGDYNLNDALALYAGCCERCANALIHKYTNGKEGYAEFSDEWLKSNTYCEYCESEVEK